MNCYELKLSQSVDIVEAVNWCQKHISNSINHYMVLPFEQQISEVGWTFHAGKKTVYISDLEKVFLFKMTFDCLPGSGVPYG